MTDTQLKLVEARQLANYTAISLAALDGQPDNTERLCTLLAERNGHLRREVERLTLLVVAYRRLDEAAREAYPHLPGKLAADVRNALDAVAAAGFNMNRSDCHEHEK
jgi:hypothetical protein